VQVFKIVKQNKKIKKNAGFKEHTCILLINSTLFVSMTKKIAFSYIDPQASGGLGN
jgi:hypothetical protein